MADVRPTKLQADGNGYGSLREFADGDTVPIALGGTGAATAAGARSNLFDPRLQNFSLLLGGVDQLPYQTGPNSWSQTPLTSIGRAMIAASTQANALSYIGGVPKSLSSNRTVSDPNTVPDECGFYGIGAGPYSNLPPGIDALNPIGSMLYHHPYDVATAVQLFVPRTSNILYFRRRVAGAWQSWVRVLSDAQLLGTVAQSGGVPLGSILERGSNANGQYARLADGTQICTISLLGANDRMANTGYTLTLPAAFTPDWTVGVSVSWVSHATNPATYNGVKVAYANGASLTFILAENLTTNRLIFSCIGRWF
ncbi:pyocin knob domain-containing protein [Pseudomonas aeruginosa]